MNNLNELKQSHKKWFTNFKTNFSILRDETKNRNLQSPSLKTIQLEITKKCNYNCIMCANSEFTSKEKKEDMSWDTFIKIINSLPKSVESVNFTSYGESTLHPLYSDMVKYIHNKGLKTNIFTNSIYLDLNLLKYYNQVIFSLDAYTNNIFKDIRGVNNAEITTKNIIQALKIRKEKNLNTRISINMVCTHINWRDAKNVMDFCEEAGVDELFITALNNNFYFLNKEKFDNLEKDLQKSIDEVDWDSFLLTYEENNYNFPLYLWYPKRDMIGFCRFPFQEMMIDKDGNMMVCCRTNNMLIGNISTMTPEEAFYNERMQKVRDAHTNYNSHPVCSICSDGYPI